MIRISKLIVLTTCLLSLSSGLAAEAIQSPDDGVGIERVFPRLRFDRPVLLCGAGDKSGRVFVIEQAGVIRVFDKSDHMKPIDTNTEVAGSKVFLDIRDRISRAGNEEGLIGVAFHPDYENNGEFFVHYSSKIKDMHGIVSRFRVSDSDPDSADLESEEVLMEIEQPYRNHNGGSIEFGQDGFLYITLGDGGHADDPHGHGQNLQSWLGCILRIDIDNKDERLEYAVPSDNPFVDTPDAKPEIWALGLRNVWRFSFDRETGELWAADVGQNKWEEIDIIKRGGNYGWNRYEAANDFKTDAVMATDEHDEPVASYGRQWGISVTGGYVYRGKDFPELQGSYFYGDYFSGNMWRIRKDDEGNYTNELVRRTGRSIASFGEDDDGELYLLSFDGGVYRVIPTAEAENMFADWPAKLSESDLYESLEERRLNSRFLAYDINAPFWSDNATKARYISVPSGEKILYREKGAWDLPVGTEVVKTFSGQHLRNSDRMLETRLIRRTETGWEAASYVWDTDGKDATLLPDGQQFELYQRKPTDPRWQVNSWHAPSSSECASCHTDAAGFVLGINTFQLNVSQTDEDNQIQAWADAGILELPDDFDFRQAPRFCDPTPNEIEEDISLDQRARVWLDVNCAMCHRPDGPGNANIDLRYETALADARLIGELPAQGDLGFTGARIVTPGKPERSLLLHRIETLGAGRMPNIGTNQLDNEAIELLREWIANMDE